MATVNWFGNGPKNLATKKVDWVADVIKVALCTSLYVPSQDTHEFFSSITNELPATGGYTAGGVTLASKTVTYDAATNETRLDAADVIIATATFSPGARIAVIYQSTGVAGTSILLGWSDFVTDMTPTNAQFSITWDATGVLKLTAA